MELSGVPIIAGRSAAGSADTFVVSDPATGRSLQPVFHSTSNADVARAAQAARFAFDRFRRTSPQERATLLTGVADRLEDARGAIVHRALAETGLSSARLEGELTRTTRQLRRFATEVLLGEHRGVRIDHAQPRGSATTDVRLQFVPLGPVAVYCASNFPLAFSVAGGDTASALAAGCPVVVQAHSAHAGTAELAGRAVVGAIADQGLPAGVFSLLFGPGPKTGQALAAHPDISAIAFTGSRAAGHALMQTAAQRATPIPVYAEMSSINPVIWLPTAAQTDVRERAAAFVASLTLGAGQFCTNPGLLFLPRQAETALEQIRETLTASSGQTMLSSRISAAYEEGLSRVQGHGANLLARGEPGSGLNSPAPVLFTASTQDFIDAPALQDEVFGAAAVIVRYADLDELRTCLASLHGQLTATIHFEPSEVETAQALLPLLEERVGRLIANSWPTGVEVVDAMVHGGPYPSTSDPRSTSVGTLAVQRFQRPVCYQGFPQAMLPTAVQDENAWGLPRRVDGVPLM